MDYNATTPIFPEVSEQIQPFISEHFGNPSSTHIYSKACRESIASSRETIRQLIGAGSKEEVIFTSCGSESNMMAVHCALNAFQMLRATDSSSTPHVVTSSIEHPSILNLLHFMEDLGRVTLSVIPVNREGVVDVEAFETAPEIKYLPSWDDVAGESGMHPADKKMDGFDSEESLERGRRNCRGIRSCKSDVVSRSKV